MFVTDDLLGVDPDGGRALEVAVFYGRFIGGDGIFCFLGLNAGDEFLFREFAVFGVFDDRLSILWRFFEHAVGELVAFSFFLGAVVGGADVFGNVNGERRAVKVYFIAVLSEEFAEFGMELSAEGAPETRDFVDVDFSFDVFGANEFGDFLFDLFLVFGQVSGCDGRVDHGGMVSAPGEGAGDDGEVERDPEDGMPDGWAWGLFVFMSRQEEGCRDGHENGGGVDSHAEPAEGVDFSGLNDDEDERAQGAADDCEGHPESSGIFAENFPFGFGKEEARQEEEAVGDESQGGEKDAIFLSELGFCDDFARLAFVTERIFGHVVVNGEH